MSGNIINKTFTALIEDRNGWICVAWPESVSYFGTSKAVKVQGRIGEVEFKTAFMPWGDGTQFLPISKKLLKSISKQPGDEIEVYLVERIVSR